MTTPSSNGNERQAAAIRPLLDDACDALRNHVLKVAAHVEADDPGDSGSMWDDTAVSLWSRTAAVSVGWMGLP